MPAPPIPAPSRAPAFAADLGRHGDRPALLTEGGALTYAELDRRVTRVAGEIGPGRLVLVEAASTVEAVVGYLAALTAGSPVLLAPRAAVAPLAAAYDPDVVLLAENGWCVRKVRPGSAHHLHPDLALLMSTSGTTGSPKLVRLSRESLSANAAAIADYLGIRGSDVGVTTLPLGYCYGLSVLHSHLERGAAVLLTELSVVDPCFWAAARDAGVTSLAGVPHTFDLLDRVGFAELDLPSLRVVTQAGGRLAPERVRAYAELGQRRGWDLYVMYGQTEATARMAYLPPDLALTHPHAVGHPLAGSSFDLETVDGTGDLELVFTGPNVMLGYATTSADLALGRTVDRLRTGDLARRCPQTGLYEIVGRRSRISKVLGLRVDLDRVEQQLAARGREVLCAGGDDELLVAAACGADAAPSVRAGLAEVSGLPLSAVRLVVVDELPRTPSGKPDNAAVRDLAGAPSQPVRSGADVDSLCALYADVLGVPAGPDDTFVGLGGDSLSYVEASLRLEDALGDLPPGWHLTPVRALAASARAPRRGRALETGVLLRALAIVAIVGSHSELWSLLGGAHVLLGLAGFNVARFLVTGDSGAVRRTLRSTARVVVPSVAFLAVAAALTERYTATNALLLNGFLGPDRWGPTWHFWFVEVLVTLLLACAALLAVPAVRRAERRHPWAFALLLVAAGTVSRYGPGWLPTGPDRIHTAHVVMWLFALGWATARAATARQRLLLSAVLLATVPGFFDDPVREAVVIAGMLALLWVRTVRLPSWLAALAAAVAAASLHVYLTHWLVHPPLEDRSALLATVASLAVGWICWAGEQRLRSWRAQGSRKNGEAYAMPCPDAPYSDGARLSAGADGSVSRRMTQRPSSTSIGASKETSSPSAG